MPLRVRRFLPAAVALAVLAAAGLWLRAQNWPLYMRLLREGAPGQAIVTAKGVGAPDNVHYTYRAEGTLHSGVGKAGIGTPPFDALEVDDEVLIFYAKGEPGVSVLGDPREHARGQNRVLAIMLLLGAPLLVVSVLRELKSQGP